MVAKVKETLSKSAALKAEKDSEDLVRAKVEKLKKVQKFGKRFSTDIQSVTVTSSDFP